MSVGALWRVTFKCDQSSSMHYIIEVNASRARNYGRSCEPGNGRPCKSRRSTGYCRLPDDLLFPTTVPLMRLSLFAVFGCCRYGFVLALARRAMLRLHIHYYVITGRQSVFKFSVKRRAPGAGPLPHREDVRRPIALQRSDRVLAD